MRLPPKESVVRTTAVAGLAVATAALLSPADSKPAPLDVLVCGGFAAETPPAASIRLMSWNIERGARLRAVVSAISREKPEVCVFQEVDCNDARTGHRDIAALLARRFGLNYVFAREFQELSQGTRESPAYHGQATLTALPIRSPRLLRFSRQSSRWLPRWYLPNWPFFQRRLGGRIALVTEIHLGNTSVAIYNVHLESQGSRELRLAQIREVVADALRYGPKRPVIIAGDLNTKSFPSPVISFLLESGFRDALPGSPRPTHRSGRKLDWIFVRGPLECTGGRVCAGIDASDHYPLAVEIAPSPSPGGLAAGR